MTTSVLNPPALRMVREAGEIKAFNYRRGFGFISVDATPPREFYAHISEFHGLPEMLIKPGEPVEFHFVAGAIPQPGKSPRAYDIRLLRKWL